MNQLVANLSAFNFPNLVYDRFNSHGQDLRDHKRVFPDPLNQALHKLSQPLQSLRWKGKFLLNPDLVLQDSEQSWLRCRG
jgi:hypothetical protein